MHPDHGKYIHLTRKSRLEKSINSLLGIIEGIAVDSHINQAEAAFLKLWMSEHRDLENRHPYTELMPVVSMAIADGVITTEEKEDILWLCERLRSTDFYDSVTADLQRLHAMLGGIAADSLISEEEIRGLSQWLSAHEHLRTSWPYEEICSLVTTVLVDRKIDESEHKILKDFFTEFLAILDGRTIVTPKALEDGQIIGLCAVCPEIKIPDSYFCFTGTSHKYTRSKFAEIVRQSGGLVVNSVTQDLNYLIIGADGNPCWSYACYGRKVEKAVQLRKKGARILLVHENDFHDAVADL